MAEIYRDPARYPIEMAFKQLEKRLVFILITFMILSIILGFVAALKNPIAAIFFIPIIYIITKYINKSLDKQKNEEIKYIKGAKGEIAVGFMLETLLPDNYNLLYSITTDYGDIDLLVVGPTGVYAIDIKNWKGKITCEKNKELLQDGAHTGFKPNTFLSTCINIKNKIKFDYYKKEFKFINCIIAFTHNNFEVNQELKKDISFISINKISNAIIENKKGQLNKTQIEELTKAFNEFANDRDK